MLNFVDGSPAPTDVTRSSAYAINLNLVAYTMQDHDLLRLHAADGTVLGFCTEERFDRVVRLSRASAIASVLRGIEESLDAIVSRLDRGVR